MERIRGQTASPEALFMLVFQPLGSSKFQLNQTATALLAGSNLKPKKHQVAASGNVSLTQPVQSSKIPRSIASRHIPLSLVPTKTP